MLRLSCAASERPRIEVLRSGASLRDLSWWALPLVRLQRSSLAGASQLAASGAGSVALLSGGSWAFGGIGGARPNNAFKPTPHRGANHMAGQACHVLHAPLRRGLTWVLANSKGSFMAHEVTLDIATKFVLHKDVEIDVKKDGRKLGTALVSKGNIEWV